MSWKNIRTGLGVLIAAVCWSATASAMPILVNPGFEAGDLSGWTITPTTGGGTNVSDVVLFDVDQIGGETNAARFNVGRTSSASPSIAGIVLSQTFEVTTAGIYGFGIDVAGHGALGQNSDGGQFALLIDGITLDSFAAGFVSSGEIKSDSLAGSINLGLGTHSFEVSIQRGFLFDGANSRQYLDDALIRAPAADVPEPATVLLLGLGLIGSALRRRI